MKIVFDEKYGHISYKQRAAYRKHNVSPYDHDVIVSRYGDNHDHAVRHVTDPINNMVGTNCYSPTEYRVYDRNTPS